MAFITIKDEKQGIVKEEDENIPSIGIDLGTTHTVIASIDDMGKAYIIGDILPSVVAYNKDGGFMVGKQAIEKRADKGLVVIASIKRLMGKGVDDSEKIKANIILAPAKDQSDDTKGVRVQVHEKALTPPQISADILKEIKNQGEKNLKKTITKAVITVPAYFDATARAETQKAAHLAGIEVLRLVNEPTAAALAYGLDEKSEGTILVYDFGGGTFDISLLKVRQGVFQVIGTGGDTQLGGDDIDRKIHEYLGIPNTMDIGLQGRALQQCRILKEALSTKEEETIAIQGKSYTLTKMALEKIAEPLIQRTIKICKEVIHRWGGHVNDLDTIVCVGGSTRMPYVQAQIQAMSGKIPLCSINPDHVVAMGAAYQAHGLLGKGDNGLLLDVLPLSLGLETMGGLMEKIIERNTSIPVAKGQEFSTYQDNQTAMIIKIYQGERELVTDNRELGQLTLRGIPPMPAGMAKVLITFTVDADGLLTVSAKEQTTQETQTVEIKPTFGLTAQEMQEMILDSLENGSQDMEKRLYTERFIEAQQLIQNTQKALKADRALLSQEEAIGITEAMDALQKLLSEKEGQQLEGARQELIKAIDKLIDKTNPFAQKRMDKAIAEALKGKAVDTLAP